MKQEVIFSTSLAAGFLTGVAASYNFSAPWLTGLLMVMFYGLQQATTVRRQTLTVFAFALGFLLASVFWIGLGIYHPPVNSLLSAVSLSVVLMLMQAVIYALVFMVVRATAVAAGGRGTVALAFSLALAWSGAEVLRSVGLWAMPWGLLGYSQLDNPLLKGLYPLIGAHGVAAASWLLAALMLQTGRSVWRWRRSRAAVDRALPLSPGQRAGWAVAFTALAVSCASSLIDWTQPSGESLRVRVVHTDWPALEKHTPEAQWEALVQLREVAALGGVDLTVLPELFLLQPPQAIPADLRQGIVSAVKTARSAVIFGSPAHGPADEMPPVRQNTLVQIDAAGNTHLYAKEILLPFSEFLPRTPLLNWAYAYLYHYPQADFSAGPAGQAPLQVRGVAAGLSICSELAYAGKSSRQARGAGLLVNASNDAWIPSRAYMRQAHTMARVRAAEAQKPMVRANNTGYSAFIDHRGQVRASIMDTAGSGVMAVAPRTGDTPYVAAAAWIADRLR